MFPQLKKINNESGIVLFIVLMAAIIIMILSVGILTQSMNEMNYAQQQIDQITSEQLSKSVFWNSYASSFSFDGGNYGISTTMEGRNYVMQVNYTPGTGAVTVSTNSDSFQ